MSARTTPVRRQKDECTSRKLRQKVVVTVSSNTGRQWSRKEQQRVRICEYYEDQKRDRHRDCATANAILIR
ncbi:hypothetical protein L596_006236 [Steinernema carpocapsae]|uniref:Uncharacterized protein n=1 Tax=Steinernema carpocapsae TaxID=34508 RepID=A0A4U8V2Z3_STECR|nr:hypothetical protein L596_006236 [Steinernema carpocapsae]